MSHTIRYDLKTGFPNMELVPRQTLKALSDELFARDAALQYADDFIGDTWTRQQVANFMTEQTSHTVAMEELHLTGGAISGTDQVVRYATRPGDIVLVENPTFYYIITKFSISHVDVMGVPMQPDGVDLDALESLCKAHGDRISLFYAIPVYHNPTGICYSEEKRKKLIALAHQYDFVIIEDVTYQWLYFQDTPPPLIRNYDPSGRVFTVTTTAKMIMPAMRIGWTWATSEQVQQLEHYKTNDTSAFMSQMLGMLIESGEIHTQFEHSRALHRRKHDIMVDMLAQSAPDWLDYTPPNGGYFIWATLPDDLKASEVLTAAQARGVDFAHGRHSFVRGEAPDNTMRLCFAMQSDEIVREGTQILCEVLHDMRT